MGVFSSGNKWKAMAQQATASAEELQEEQQEIDFGRAMLSNIRQQRIAQAQLTTANYSPSFTSTGAIGAASNINSALAGEAGYSYSTSLRQQRISDYQADAERYMKKYAKQQKRRGQAIQVAAIAAAALTGGALGMVGLAGGLTATQAAVVGATVGGGIGKAITGDVAGGVQAGINAYGMTDNYLTANAQEFAMKNKLDQLNNQGLDSDGSIHGVAESLESESYHSPYMSALYNANANQIASDVMNYGSYLNAYLMKPYGVYR